MLAFCWLDRWHGSKEIDIDTGATHCFISEKFARLIGLAVEPCTRAVALADGKTVRAKGIAKARIRIGEYNDVCTFLVLQLNAAYDVLLGEDWLTKHNAVLNFQQGSMKVSRSTCHPVVIKRPPIAEQASSGGGEAGTAGEQVAVLLEHSRCIG
jgi:predicted aspartyl protease